MNIKVEGILYTLGGILRLFDFSSDVFYLYSQDFKEDWIFYASAVSLVTPSSIFFLIFLFSAIRSFCMCKCRISCVYFFLGVGIAILDPLGLVSCILGCFLLCSKSKKQDFNIIEAITRSVGFVEGIFESLPQLVLQTYNNYETQSWDFFTITSVSFSAGGFLYTCIKLICALDNISHDATHGRRKKYTLAIRHMNSHLPVAQSEDPEEMSIHSVYNEDN